MLLIYGKKSARIKTSSDHSQRCSNCGAFAISVAVFQDYFHLFYIPVWTMGPKNAKAWCGECGHPFGTASFEKDYEAQARTPFYLYSLTLLFALFIAAAVIAGRLNQNEKAAFVRSPKKGDTYLIRKDEKDTARYFFLQIQKIKGDSITVYHSGLIYLSYAESMAASDSFISSDPLHYSVRELQQMLDAGEISSIKR